MPQPHITKAQQHFTKAQPHLTEPQPHITKPQPHITKAQPRTRYTHQDFPKNKKKKAMARQNGGPA